MLHFKHPKPDVTSGKETIMGNPNEEPTFRDTSLVHSPFASGWFEKMFEDFGMSFDSQDWNITPFKKTVNGNQTILEFNLAGYDSKDIKIKLDNTLCRLTITAESKTKTGNKKFSTHVSLNPCVQSEDITAQHINGLLTITLKYTDRTSGTIKDIPIETE